MSEKNRIGLNPEGQPEKFPQVWANKLSGQLFVVMPWWEIMDEDTMVDGHLEMLTGEPDKRRFKFGMLAQVGWLIENGSGVFFGVGTSAADCMEKVGEL